MTSPYSDLNTSPRILLGPGPSMVHPRVLRTMATPLVGHLDPQFIHLMNEVQDLLRMVFEAPDALTFPVSDFPRLRNRKRRHGGRPMQLH